MEDTEYELVSHDEVDRLKREIGRLKTNPFVQNSSEEKLYESISRLNDSVNKLYSLFENINKQLMKEYQTGNSPEEKIDTLLEQNKSIAEAIISIGSKMDNEPEEEQSNIMQKQFSEPQVQQQVSSQKPVQTMPVFPQQQVQPQKPVQTMPVFPQQQMQPQQQVQAPRQMQSPVSQPQNLQRQNISNTYPADDIIPPSPGPNQGQFQQGVFQRQNMMQQQVQPQQMRQMTPPMPQAPQYSQMYSQEETFNPPRPQARSFDTGLNVNYPVPDRFDSLNAPPSISVDAPIDLVPPAPKRKGLGGILSGIIKK